MVTWKQVHTYKNMLVQFENEHIFTWKLHDFASKYYSLLANTDSYPDESIRYYEEHAKDTHAQFDDYYIHHIAYLKHLKKVGIYLGLRTEHGYQTKLALDLVKAYDAKMYSMETERRRGQYRNSK